MVAHRNMPRATQAERDHMARVRELPCCLCLKDAQQTPTECHHLKIGNKRMGHMYVIPVCDFHHRNIHQFPHLMRSLWQQTMDTLGMVMSWPISKIVSRRA